ncbi:MAG: hypothetical protein P9L92_02450 [Candidatus Electryonea clarkiae]|nr:hypothetical protein [Candidatus Electryonea clarkiae]MDP8285120.1 hypothetical protein [Candidatus Electryonea clarkiae]
MKKFIVIAILAGFFVILVTDQANSIPAFARKYRMSCTTCHNPFPRLKDYGDEFAGNGFMLEDQESPRYYVDTGDMNLSLIRDLPVALRVESYAIMDETNNKDLDFRTPYKIKFLSGGSLSDHVSYYMYFYFDERGVVEGLDDAFIMFNNLIGQDLDLYVGQFSLSDPMLKSELKLTYEAYAPYKAKIGDSNIKLSYDRGLMATWGLPINTGTGVTAMVVNGNGIGAANPDHSFDSDANKVFAGHLSQDIFGIAGLGIFGLYGNEDGDTTVFANEVNVIGVDLGFSLGPVDISGQWLQRSDSDPQFAGNPTDDIVTNGIIAEAVLWPHGDHSKWYAAGLYNQTTSDLVTAEYQSATGHIGYLVRTNVRLGLEGTYDLDNEKMILGFGINAAF